MDASAIRQLGRGRIVYRTCIDEYLAVVNNSNENIQLTAASGENSTGFMPANPVYNSFHYRVLELFN